MSAAGAVLEYLTYNPTDRLGGSRSGLSFGADPGLPQYKTTWSNEDTHERGLCVLVSLNVAVEIAGLGKIYCTVHSGRNELENRGAPANSGHLQMKSHIEDNRCGGQENQGAVVSRLRFQTERRNEGMGGRVLL